MKHAYPEVRVFTESGEVITIAKRPRRHELMDNEELTGEYRVPRKGEYYWYPFDPHAITKAMLVRSGVTGKVTHCSGQARNRFHIIRKVIPRIAVYHPTGGWTEMTVDEMKTLLQGV